MSNTATASAPGEQQPSTQPINVSMLFPGGAAALPGFARARASGALTCSIDPNVVPPLPCAQNPVDSDVMIIQGTIGAQMAAEDAGVHPANTQLTPTKANAPAPTEDAPAPATQLISNAPAAEDDEAADSEATTNEDADADSEDADADSEDASEGAGAGAAALVNGASNDDSADDDGAGMDALAAAAGLAGGGSDAEGDLGWRTVAPVKVVEGVLGGTERLVRQSHITNLYRILLAPKLTMNKEFGLALNPNADKLVLVDIIYKKDEQYMRTPSSLILEPGDGYRVLAEVMKHLTQVMPLEMDDTLIFNNASAGGGKTKPHKDKAFNTPGPKFEPSSGDRQAVILVEVKHFRDQPSGSKPPAAPAAGQRHATAAEKGKAPATKVPVSPPKRPAAPAAGQRRATAAEKGKAPAKAPVSPPKRPANVPSKRPAVPSTNVPAKRPAHANNFNFDFDTARRSTQVMTDMFDQMAGMFPDLTEKRFHDAYMKTQFGACDPWDQQSMQGVVNELFVSLGLLK